MHRLIYTSRSLIGNDRGKLDAIVDRSIYHNDANGITGMLWSDGANFAQVLEGEHGAIAATMSRIHVDCRHNHVEIVLDRPITRRMFGRWAMAVPKRNLESADQTAFLVGFAAGQETPPARRLYDIVMASDEFGNRMC